jgi:putative methionine-R-sulfoxide reductase with GAF domain
VLIDGSIPGEAYRTASMVLVPDVKRDPRYAPIRPRTRSEIAVPVRLGGKVVGVLLVDSIIELDAERAKTAHYLAIQIALLLNG